MPMRLLFSLLLLLSMPVRADTGLPVPRFVSLRANQVNLRTGPGTRYPVEWVFLKSDLPVEIIEEFEHWRKIRDFKGKTGWVHQQMLSGRRMIRVKQNTVLLRAASVVSVPIAKVEAQAVGKIMMCPAGLALCKVDFSGTQGWISRDKIWGVYPQESFE